MIRQIGVSDYGLYSLVVTFISYFVIDFGLSSTVTRFIAKYRAEGNDEKVKNMMGLVMKVYLAIDSIIFITLFVLYFFISNIFQGLTPTEQTTLKGLYAIAGLFSVLTFALHPINGAMMAYEYFVESKFLDMVHRVGMVLLIVVCLLLGGGVYFLVLVNGAVGFCISLTKYLVFVKKSRLKINWLYFEKSLLKSLFSFSAWIFLINMAQRLRLTFMPSIIGIFSNSIQISIFALGMQIEGMVWTLSSALNGLFLPKVTRLSRDGNSEEITQLMIRVGRIQLYIISLIFFGFFILGADFLDLWVGSGFEDTYYVVLFLIATNMVTLTQSVAGDLVYAENKVQYTGSITFITSAFSMILSILLVPQMGALGCGLAFFVAMTIYLILLNIFYLKKLKLDIFKFFVNCHVRIIPLLVVISGCFYWIKSYFHIESWTSFFLFGGGFFIVFMIVAYLFLFNTNEKGYIRALIIKKK